jgi:hypothetical protein
VLGTDEILARLRAKKIRNVDIARALELPDSRVPAIFRKERRLTLEEGVRLVEAFGLEEAPLSPLPPSILRLVALHIARSLGAETGPEDARMRELLADLEAFSRFVADPQVRESIAAAERSFGRWNFVQELLQKRRQKPFVKPTGVQPSARHSSLSAAEVRPASAASSASYACTLVPMARPERGPLRRPALASSRIVLAKAVRS